MSLTIPDGLASVASLVGVPAGLFAWDEDKLEATGTAVGGYAHAAAPLLRGTEQASAQYTTANAGASGDAFADRWAADAGSGETSNALDTTVKVAAALGLAAGLIKVAKMGVINYLVWCGRQLQLGAAGGLGALNAVRSTLLTRAGIHKLWRTLQDKLEQLVLPHLRNGRDLLQGVAGRRAVLNGGGGTVVLRSPYGGRPPSTLQMNMARRSDSGGEEPIRLSETAGGSTMKQRFDTAEAAEKYDDVRVQDLANDGRNN
ncbi:hypothetical protein [Nonomuraea rhizosphaerae]|uniref:hypothetical protein n=1 Tax=Nonomuraea rhizosphaerae TaxID=2665663 RepID=UPI001C5E3E69|nr:hypothetical protein [Nonomuraea rhizosphaerae]